jgi:DNA damage-inducible protein 1
MQGRDVDLLFGLDMLKAHQACIDLEKNVLRIQGREVSFLSEHEVPEKTRVDDLLEVTATGESSAEGSYGSAGGSNAASSSQSHGSSGSSSNSRYPESAIRILMDLGVSRELAISTLDAAGGNVDAAASLLF